MECTQWTVWTSWSLQNLFFPSSDHTGSLHFESAGWEAGHSVHGILCQGVRCMILLTPLRAYCDKLQTQLRFLDSTLSLFHDMNGICVRRRVNEISLEQFTFRHCCRVASAQGLLNIFTQNLTRCISIIMGTTIICPGWIPDRGHPSVNKFSGKHS